MTTIHGIAYTANSMVKGIKITAIPLAGQYTTGYGPKIPTRYMLRYLNRWRRVYVVNYGNSGSSYIIVDGHDHYLDTDTEYDIYDYRDSEASK